MVECCLPAGVDKLVEVSMQICPSCMAYYTPITNLPGETLSERPNDSSCFASLGLK